MRQNENYSGFVVAALILTLGIFGTFQFYITQEPERITTDEKRDQLIAATAGRTLYSENCMMCHGEQGEGVDGPPLNDKTFLNNTTDDRIFSLISSGVPSSEMPAWGQPFGGPLTDQQMDQLVVFIREWQENAPDREAEALEGDAVQGLLIFNNTCVVCHGDTGVGTEIAPALNDPEKLGQLDDEWYIDTISQGRPAQGMPTWGTVLSPVEMRDLVALLRAWESGETVEPPGPEEELAEALHLLDHSDLHAAEHSLQVAAEGASGDVLAAIKEAIEAAEAGDLAATEDAINEALALLGVGAEEHADGDEHADGEEHADE